MKLKGTKGLHIVVSYDKLDDKSRISLTLPKTVAKALLKDGSVEYECEFTVTAGGYKMPEKIIYDIELSE